MVMEKKAEKRLNKRALAAMVALISGMGLPFTGLGNHLLHSSSLHGPRHFWIVTHEVLGILFMVSAIWHVLLNHKALVRYIRDSVGRVSGVSREAFWAAALVGIMLFVSVGHLLLAH
jgi:hypothetical protein